MNASSQPWPPQSEPVTPLLVVARLDELAFSPAEYRLVANTARHALVERNSTFLVVDLVDGHEVTWYDTEDSAWRAWAVLKRRDEEDERGTHILSTPSDEQGDGQ